MRLATLFTLALALGSLAGCASSLRRADRLFEARAYAEAASAYREALESGAAETGRDRALFRLALVHALPGSPVNDPERARELLEELTRSYERSPYSFEATLILELEGRGDRLRAEAERQRLEIANLEAQAWRHGQDAEELRTTLAELNRKLASLGEDIAECEQQLERLKAIDLDGTR